MWTAARGAPEQHHGAPNRGVKGGLPPGRAGGPAFYFVQDFSLTSAVALPPQASHFGQGGLRKSHHA